MFACMVTCIPESEQGTGSSFKETISEMVEGTDSREGATWMCSNTGSTTQHITLSKILTSLGPNFLICEMGTISSIHRTVVRIKWVNTMKCLE